MAIPLASSFPDALDTDTNLYMVHDALRVRLAEDYKPGDKIIKVFGPEEILLRFPPTGIITLTEQCSEPKLRALSFYYSRRTLTTFEGLEILPGFTDTTKPKNITDVTQNVMDYHHNTIKNAVIAVQKFAGKKGEEATQPLTGTMEARINYLRRLVLQPKAWFSANKTIGLVPLSVEFKDLSFRLGTDGTAGKITYIWDFGDNTSPSVITISATTVVPTDATNVVVSDLDGGTVLKTYTRPGIFDVKLTVKNDFGEDTAIFPALINARVQAPNEAVIKFIGRTGQIHTPGTPSNGPYTTFPKMRSPVGTVIDIEVPTGTNPSTGRTFAGEALDANGNAIDPITAYTWHLADDLTHSNAASTRAVYSVGGIYDLILRVDTLFGAYRITTYEDAIDIVEKDNLWVWTYSGSSQVRASEFGLISEVFKTKVGTLLTISPNDSFLTGALNETQQKREFKRNIGFTQRGTTSSGNGGVCLLWWASGRSGVQPASDETIKFAEYNGFTDVYTTRPSVSRPWNWASLASATDIYFVFGGVTTAITPFTSPTNQTKQAVRLQDLVVTSTTFSTSNYKNGADELMKNVVTFNGAGNPEQGHMSVYRTAWRQDTGFLLRNDGVDTFFRIKSFYKTSGTTTDPFVDIRKLTDMSGPAKLEGQLVPLSKGVYFFNNSGAISAFNPTTSIWETGGPGINSASFRLLQDNTVIGFDKPENTLTAASNGDKLVYLSYDYSSKAFIKFNETDLTFSGVTPRPIGSQWQIGIF